MSAATTKSSRDDSAPKAPANGSTTPEEREEGTALEVSVYGVPQPAGTNRTV